MHRMNTHNNQVQAGAEGAEGGSANERARKLALEIVDPWLNSDPCAGCSCDRVCKKLTERIAEALARSMRGI